MVSKLQGFKTVGVNGDFPAENFHKTLNEIRQEEGYDISFKQALSDTFGGDMTPEKFYLSLGIEPDRMSVNKLITSNELTRWVFPEIVRDAIRAGLDYAPFYKQLITGEERIENTGLTMPKLNPPAADDVRMRDVAEAASITMGKLGVWTSKQVTIAKKGRGMEQTYESIMFTPMNLARIYFEELGARLGADIDYEVINILINGDQANGSESAPVIGAGTAGALTYLDIARAWIRFKRINRNSAAMIMSEADAITVLNMEQFQNRHPAGGQSISGVTLRIDTPLPNDQAILIHDSMPASKILFVDPARAVVQLTAWPLMIEGQKLIDKQINQEYASMMTGFANVFRDGRLLLDYSTNLATNPGPVAHPLVTSGEW